MIFKTRLQQRADYTHKFNMRTGRHGWLRLTPAYSVKVVDELMNQYAKPLRVLDPFCGTATTALSAAYHGNEGFTTDINPFLVWLGQTKTTQYSQTSINSTQDTCLQIMEALQLGEIEPADVPPISNVDRWWDPEALDFLRRLKTGIESYHEENSPEHNLLRVAFCRTLIELSNAAFNHQSMSFKHRGQFQIPFEHNMTQLFYNHVRFVLNGAEENPLGISNVVSGDARILSKAVRGLFDLVITSPPYVNRMSYIRELRPYMYWLGFLGSGRDAGELDWSAIGGTWGVATSRLTNWEPPENPFRHPMLDMALRKIAHSDNKNGHILANYVDKYFQDIWKHFNSLILVLNKDAELHYIIGNSTFYGILLSVEILYGAMLERLGFENVEYHAIRKRNSKKELLEFDVSARWPV